MRKRIVLEAIAFVSALSTIIFLIKAIAQCPPAASLISSAEKEAIATQQTSHQ